MKKLIAIAAVSAMSLPAAALATPGNPDPGQHKGAGYGVAAKACNAERQQDAAAFDGKYADTDGKFALRSCIAAHVQQARETCDTEKAADAAAFSEQYGNKKGKHAYRRCVREHAADAVA